MGPFDVLVAILVISVLIIVHEFGHYFCAVKTGMRVDRFSVLGIGPVVARLFTYKGTEFVISAIPFGAYVHIVGMEADDPEPPRKGGELPAEPGADESGPVHAPGTRTPADDKHLFRNRPLWARMLTIFGGPLANYMAAVLIIFGLLAVAGSPTVMSLAVDDVQSEAAKTAGVKVGDEILSIAGASTVDPEGRAYDKIIEATGAHKSETVPLVVRRDGAEVTLNIAISEKGLMGVGLREGEVQRGPASLSHSIKTSITYPYDYSVNYLGQLYKLVTGRIDATLSGPVGIVKQIAKSAHSGAYDLVKFAAQISILLGLFNLLPLPALDGGRLVFLFYELIARRPANRRIEEMIHAIGMLALLGLIAYVTIFNDIGGKH